MNKPTESHRLIDLAIALAIVLFGALSLGLWFKASTTVKARNAGVDCTEWSAPKPMYIYEAESPIVWQVTGRTCEKWTDK